MAENNSRWYPVQSQKSRLAESLPRENYLPELQYFPPIHLLPLHRDVPNSGPLEMDYTISA